jgi:hypothetical protein
VAPWVVMSMGERMGDSEGVGIVASLPAAAGPASDSEAEARRLSPLGWRPLSWSGRGGHQYKDATVRVGALSNHVAIR